MQREIKSEQTPPRTQIGELRDLLVTIERRMAKLKEISPEIAREILLLLDQATKKLETQKEAGGSVSSEASQFESLLMQFRRKGNLFVARAGGAAALQRARKEHQPSESHWWWFIDQTLAQERQAKMRRWIVGLAIAGAVLAILAVGYQQFLAPDPEFQAGVGFQQTAENKLIAGDYEAALDDLDQAIERLPNASELLVMRGVIFEVLEQPDLAQENYAAAQASMEGDEAFYNARARYYLMSALPELAIADAETVLSTNPDAAISYMYIGQAHEILGDIPKAIEFYGIASEVAERTENATLQVMARMQLATLLQQGALPTMETPEE